MDQDLLEKISAYVRGELSGAEKKAFEEELAQNPTLQDEVAFEKQLLILGQQELFKFDEQLGKAGKTYHKGKRNIRFRIVALATTVLILFLAWAIYPRTSYFDQYFKPFPIDLVKKANPKATDLIQLYQDMDWEHVIPLIKDWSHSDEKHPVPKLYLSVAYLGANEPKKAITLLKEITREPNMVSEQASWYLALAYLKENHMEEASSILKRIKKFDHYGADQAILLLKDLHVVE